MSDKDDCTAMTFQPKESVRVPRWSAFTAFFTAWVLPATTARRTGHVPLACAWLVHFVAVVLSVLLVVFFVAWGEAESAWSLVEITEEFGLVLEDVIEEVRSFPVEFTLAVGGIALAIESGFPLLALLVMPWGARDEPLRSSYRHSLRQTWLRTAHVVACVVLVGGVVMASLCAKVAWERQNPYPSSASAPSPPRPPNKDDPSYEQALADYNIAFAMSIQALGAGLVELEQSRQEWRARRPWYVRVWPLQGVACGAAALLWLLWGLLRAVGAVRDVSPIERPPTCEACGYNLKTIPPESRCPECGVSVATSLGPDARTGTAWQRRGESGWLVAWWQCTVTAVNRPIELGRQLRVISPETEHRAFLALHLPAIFLIGMAGVLTFAVLEDGVGVLIDENAIFLAIGSCMFGLACVGGAVLFALGVALVIGMLHSARYSRNSLPASVQAACYLSGYLVVWAMFGAASGCGLNFLAGTYWLEALASPTFLGPYEIAFFLWMIANAVWCVGYFLLVSRGRQETRYANR